MPVSIRPFFDEATNTASYLVHDPATGQAMVIDPVLDWNNRDGTADTVSADAILAAAEGLTIARVLETHAHADHLTAAPYIKARTGARIGIGDGIRRVQQVFRPFFDLADVAPEGGDFDDLFADGATFGLGSLTVRVLATPGHTPACVSYLVEDAAFIGDTLFMPDFGTARCDFPGGDATTLFRSIHRLLDLPPNTRLFTAHDYKAPGRDVFAWESTVADQRAHNLHVHDGVAEADFVAMRQARDAKLPTPLLLLPSLQVNIRAGRFPAAEANGVRYLRVPVTLAGGLRGA